MNGWLIALPLGLLGLFSAGHALLKKRDPRSALGWIVICLAFPGAGAALYWLLGVNRIRTRARSWQAQGRGMAWGEPASCDWSVDLAAQLPFARGNMRSLLRLSDSVTRRPLVQGNRIDTLHNGEAAYPAMLEAIGAARGSVELSTYIFDSDGTGRRFATALREASQRGVDVRLLIDGLGERYSFPVARRLFRGSPVQVARFLPPSLSGRGLHLNLRNHRKILVVDGAVGFTGGMNIGDRHLVATPGRGKRVGDIHFRLRGPVVGQLREAFAEDWGFVTGEHLPEVDPPAPVDGGEAFCRGISAGPNEDFEKLNWILTGALNSARQSIRIMTPYFVPDRALITALNAAALRGVAVEIILPQRNNLPYVAWASRALFWEVLQHGPRVYLQPPPFVHSKMLLIDQDYALVGSANLDQRSLRLNFEFNLEVYSRSLNVELSQHFTAVRERSFAVTLAGTDGRSLPVKLRDAAAKLFSPYL